MKGTIDRRNALKIGAALAASQVMPAWAQDKPLLRMAGMYLEKDIRYAAIQMLARDVAADFTIQQYLMGSLFKQGTELVAVQRDNLEMANIAPADVTKQIPAWSILTSAYLFRDANHMLAYFKSDVGAQMNKMAEDQLNIKILGPIFYGTRQVGLKPTKKITTPADMADIKLRMPAGDAWQLLGRALGANPTPIAFPELYTALQTGTVDGQDNPLPIVQANKFYEVMSQIVLTSHWVAYDLLILNRKVWNNMGAGKQKTFQAAADKALAYCAEEHLKREAALVEALKKEGLAFSTPDIDAFRRHAQKVYLASEEAKAWPAGLLEKIAAVK